MSDMADLLVRVCATFGFGLCAVLLFGSAWGLAGSRHPSERPFALLPALLAGACVLLAAKVWL